jgi:hypothetical protein
MILILILERGIILKTNDKIIWDSGFGYSVGTYIQDRPEDDWLIGEHATIKVHSNMLVRKLEVLNYTEKNLNKMQLKYQR